MSWVSIGIAAVGLVTTVYGQQKAKKAEKADAQFLAGQQIDAAGRSRAIGQRQAEEERRNARLADSALQARAMGGGSDVSVQQISSDIAGEGEYRALSALYEGNEGALGLENQANAGLRTAKARNRARDYQTAGTIIGSAGGMYSKYAEAGD